MKLALLLPGYLDSCEYLHMKVFDDRLNKLGYTVERFDPCGLWSTNKVELYSISNYINQIKDKISSHDIKSLEEVLLIGHSLGGFVAIVAGAMLPEITKIVSLCPPPDLAGASIKWNSSGIRTSERDLPDNPEQTRIFNIPISFAEDAEKYSALESIAILEKPIMILIGMEDTVVFPEESEKLVKKSSKAYVVKLAGIGHDFRKSYNECTKVMEEIEKFII